MRIGIDVNKVLPPRDGMGNYTHQLLRALAEQDLEDRFLLYGLPSAADREAFSRELPELPDRFELQDRAWPRPGDVDLMHCTGMGCPPEPPRAMLFTCYDLTFLTHPELHTVRNRVHCLVGLLEAILAGAVFLAISHATAARLREEVGIDGQRIRVIHLAADPRFRPQDRVAVRRRLAERFGLDGDFVLAVGTLEPRKNLVRLVRAWAALSEELRRRHPLVIAGPEGWKHQEFDELLTDLAVEDRPRLLGYVGDDDLVALYNGTSLFVYPSLVEGFGLPPLEALSCGAPVLTSNATSLPEVVGEAARLVDPLAEDDLRRAMEELLSHPEATQPLRQRALEQASRFSWERTARETAELYREMATGQTP
jgi:glycosyltransferase involved in cell wall biosynthesis